MRNAVKTAKNLQLRNKLLAFERSHNHQKAEAASEVPLDLHCEEEKAAEPRREEKILGFKANFKYVGLTTDAEELSLNDI